MEQNRSGAEYDYSVLRPPQDVFNVKHSDYYIQHGEGDRSVRRILYGVQWTDQEKEKIKQLHAELEKINFQLPPSWNESESIRMIYDQGGDVIKAVEALKKYVDFLNEPKWTQLDTTTEEFLKSGAIYVAGKDKQYRPIIVINFDKFKVKEEDNDKLIRTIVYASAMVKKHAFVPGYVENWIMMVDMNGAGLMNFPMAAFKSFIQTTQLYFTLCLERLYILNPSFMIMASWTMLKGVIDPITAERVEFLKKEQFKNLHATIDPSQLEEKFGGTHKDLTVFWPPKRFTHEPPYELKKKEEPALPNGIHLKAETYQEKLPEVKVEITMKEPETKTVVKVIETKPQDAQTTKPVEEKPKPTEEKPKPATTSYTSKYTSSTTTTKPAGTETTKQEPTSQQAKPGDDKARTSASTNYSLNSGYKPRQTDAQPTGTTTTQPADDKSKVTSQYVSKYSSKPIDGTAATTNTTTTTNTAETKPAAYTSTYVSKYSQNKPADKEEDKKTTTATSLTKLTENSTTTKTEGVHYRPNSISTTTQNGTIVTENAGTQGKYVPMSYGKYQPKATTVEEPKKLPNGNHSFEVDFTDDLVADFETRKNIPTYDLSGVISKHSNFLSSENRKIAYPVMIFKNRSSEPNKQIKKP